MRATMVHLLSAAEQARDWAAPPVVAPRLALHHLLQFSGIVMNYSAHACCQNAVFMLYCSCEVDRCLIALANVGPEGLMDYGKPSC